MNSGTRDAECSAASVLAHFLCGEATRVDPGGGPTQLHDLDLHLEDGRTIAVEVTRHNHPEHLAAAAEVRKLDWRFSELSHDWVVDTIPSVGVKNLHREIGPLLKELEARSVTTLLIRSEMFDGRRSNRTTVDTHVEAMASTGTLEVGRGLFQLGVRLVYQLGESDPDEARVIVGEASQVGSAGPGSVVAAVERHAGLADNIKKLQAASDRDERHLFVWAERSRLEVVAAFDFTQTFGVDGLPDAAPTLPDTIDAVWVATATRPVNIWRYSRAFGWEDLGTYRSGEPDPED